MGVTWAIEASVTKRYGARTVLSDAKLAVRPGTVHALVGENGAGKSTLVKIIAGIVRADGGVLTVADRTVDLASWDRRRARAERVGIVQQHGASAGTLTVVENAVLGVEPVRHGLLALDGVAQALHDTGAKIGLAVEPHARVDELSLGAAQRSEIAAALYHGADVLVLDEPTAVLAPVEVAGMLVMLRELAAQGTTIIIVTHKLDEVRRVADDVTVLRAGATVARFSAEATPERFDVAAIARAMVGADLPEAMQLPEPPSTAPTTLELVGLGVGTALADVALLVRRGELVGVAGVDGNGQRELALAIAGLVPARGRVVIGGSDASAATPARRLALGLAHIPEDRHHGGLVLDGTVADNLALGRRDVTGRFAIDRAAVAKHAAARIADLDIRPADPSAIVGALSGGNQQKVVIGRELSRPVLRAVVASQPTRGVDLGAVARIHDRLRAAAVAGAGVLVISADLDELLGLCHRIVVLLRGRLVGEVAGEALRGDRARSALGALMTGAAA